MPDAPSPLPPRVPETAAATFCATLIDEWARRGITAAFAAPGSRSTPLVLALDVDPRIDLHVFHDERSASFAALGWAATTGTAGIVACSSGTAATHFHAAIVEADLSAVPMIVCTADRPPELWDRGAPQTIDQTRLYGKAVRLFAEPGPADHAKADTWRPLAIDLADHAMGRRGGRPGPVHANLSFRDPLVGRPTSLPPVSDPATAIAPPAIADTEAARIASWCRRGDGAIVAGRGVSDPAAITELATTLGWPLIADHPSGARRDTSIRHADALLRHPAFADGERPTTILRFGQPHASKALSEWIVACAAAGANVAALHQPGRLIDPEDVATLVAPERGAAEAIMAALDRTELTHPDRPGANETSDASPLDGVTTRPLGVTDSPAVRWQAADRAAQKVISAGLARAADSEVAVTVRAATSAGPDGIVVAASSMPIRYLEWFAPEPGTGRVLSNRGANGIDGTIATAIGAALTGAPTVCVVGDVAFLHDSSSLVGLADRGLDLTVVVIDNDGGGIFSFLPQAELIDAERFDRLFGTPHRSDLVALARAHRLAATDDTTDLTPQGTRVVVARTAARADNVTHVRELIDAVADELG